MDYDEEAVLILRILSKSLPEGESMGLLHKIRQRLDGTYRLKDRERVSRQLPAVQQMLQSGKVTDEQAREMLTRKLDVLSKQKNILRLATWIGTPRARALQALFVKDKRIVEDNTIWHILPYLSKDKTFFDFDGLKLPAPESKSDEELLSLLFEDVLSYHVCSSLDTEEVSQGFGDEGPYEPDALNRVEENDVVFDCGANIGDFSIVAAARGCDVYAFEPSQYIINKYLKKTVELNTGLSGKITICPYAVSDEAGEADFLIDMNNIGGSRTNDPLAHTIDKDKCIEERVQVIRLDDFVEERKIARVDFIKADIEGAERRMLLGAKNILKNFSPKLSICTYHLPDDPEVLRGIILEAQPNYTIIQREHKLHAYVPSV